eukprot:CAMPEP_0113664070 /NCGR_PEP_ID=MMETSP0038_2-20120614/1517_1 /TAXON_ID=2898 /ORGANISM="Cryptomonas paramecium" /LENGTH=167 /DNA_ID=CAMNT_0000579215 /DNA_START=267 /DNA_END=768 /DNA_ORIENTATION=+ /assembly_acc=CAM_ASM_000170
MENMFLLLLLQHHTLNQIPTQGLVGNSSQHSNNELFQQRDRRQKTTSPPHLPRGVSKEVRDEEHRRRFVATLEAMVQDGQLDAAAERLKLWKPRWKSPEAYTLMIRSFARARDVDRCMEVLRDMEAGGHLDKLSGAGAAAALSPALKAACAAGRLPEAARLVRVLEG